jgi:hypothetical protein
MRRIQYLDMDESRELAPASRRTEWLMRMMFMVGKSKKHNLVCVLSQLHARESVALT